MVFLYFACWNWQTDESGEEEQLTSYSYDYYGIKDDHSESTLVVDDDRGKYIRDDATAERFCCWMLSWYMHQHLKMKLKLP